MNEDLIPPLNPIVKDHLLQCPANEVELYKANLVGKKCLLCPFRSFDRIRNLTEHVKHHCMKNMFMSDIRSPQRAVIRALYDYYQSTRPISYLKVDNLNLLSPHPQSQIGILCVQMRL